MQTTNIKYDLKDMKLQNELIAKRIGDIYGVYESDYFNY